MLCEFHSLILKCTQEMFMHYLKHTELCASFEITFLNPNHDCFRSVIVPFVVLAYTQGYPHLFYNRNLQ